MLDGVFETGNQFFDIRRQRATTLDGWPERDRWGQNHGAVQADRIEIVVEIRPPTTMKRITGLPHTGPTVLPATRSTDVGASLVREEHISASVDALRVPLQAPGARGQRLQVGIVSDHYQHIDILRVRLRRHDRPEHRDSPHASNPSSSCYKRA